MSEITSEKLDSTPRKEYKTWRKSVEINEKSRTVIVEEAENGFIVKVSETDFSGNDYKDKQKKFISKKNPLEKEDNIDKASEMLDSLRGFFEPNPLNL